MGDENYSLAFKDEWFFWHTIS